MKYILYASFLLLAACSKNNDNTALNRTLSVMVKDHQPPNTANHYWGVHLTFDLAVTLDGSIKVDYDVYNMGAFYKHYSYKFPFSLSNQNTFIYNTQEASAPPGQGWEVKNLKIDSLQTNSNYKITIK